MKTFEVDKNFNNDIIEYLKSHNLVTSDETLNYQIYTLEHKQAFMALYYLLTGEINEIAVNHDSDKPVLYGLPEFSRKQASKIHVGYARHHIDNCITEEDLISCVIDYECARYTKPDKPLNAYNTIMKYKPETYTRLKPILERFNLDSPDNRDLDFSSWNANKHDILESIKPKILANMEKFRTDVVAFGVNEALTNAYSSYLMG